MAEKYFDSDGVSVRGFADTNFGPQTMAEVSAEPESSVPITSSQSGDERLLEIDRNSQSDFRRRKNILESSAVKKPEKKKKKKNKRKGKMKENMDEGDEGHIPTESPSFKNQGNEQKDEGAENETYSISGGEFVGANFGPQTKTEVSTVLNITNASITNMFPRVGSRRLFVNTDEYSRSEKREYRKGHRKKRLTRVRSASHQVDIETAFQRMVRTGDKRARRGIYPLSDDISIDLNEPMEFGECHFKGFRFEGTRRQKVAVQMFLCHEINSRMIKRFKKCRSHPNVADIIDFGACDGDPNIAYIAMAPCNTLNLQQYLDENEFLDFNRKMSFTKQLFDAVENLYRNNMIHGDLTPTTVLLSKDEKQIQISPFYLDLCDTSHHRLQSDRNRRFRSSSSYCENPSSSIVLSLGLTLLSLWTNEGVVRVNEGKFNVNRLLLHHFPIDMREESKIFSRLLNSMLQDDQDIRSVSSHPFFKAFKWIRDPDAPGTYSRVKLKKPLKRKGDPEVTDHQPTVLIDKHDTFTVEDGPERVSTLQARTESIESVSRPADEFWGNGTSEFDDIQIQHRTEPPSFRHKAKGEPWNRKGKPKNNLGGVQSSSASARKSCSTGKFILKNTVENHQKSWISKTLDGDKEADRNEG